MNMFECDTTAQRIPVLSFRGRVKQQDRLKKTSGRSRGECFQTCEGHSVRPETDNLGDFLTVMTER